MDISAKQRSAGKVENPELFRKAEGGGYLVSVGFGLVLAVLSLNIWLTYRNTRQLNEDAYWVAHTHEVIAISQEILSLMKDAETGQRGYVITGEARYLEPYNASVAVLNEQVRHLEELTTDNPQQQERLLFLKTHISSKLIELEQTIALRREQGFDATRQVVLTDKGKQAMDDLRAIVQQMVHAEEGLLRERAKQSDQAYHFAIITGLIAGLSSLASVVAFMTLLRRLMKVRSKAAFVIAEQGERLRTTLASIGDAVLTTDMEGRITNLNAVAETLTGWKNDEAVGEPLDAVFRIVNEKTRQPVENPATRSLREGVIVGLANHTVLIARDGMERPIDDSAAPIRCKEGESVGCVLVFRDVTERRQAELSLEQSEERLRFVMDSMPQKIFTAKPNGNVDYFNPVWTDFTGLPFEKIRDWGWTQFVHPDDMRENVRVWKHSIDTAEAFQFEHRLRRADGGYRWHISRALPMRDEAGQVMMWVGSSTDIHEQKLAANELRELTAELSEAHRRKDEFLATLAHELRNPLAPLRNALQILKITGGSSQVFDQTREMMERQLHQMVRLVDDLLDVSRITRGKMELRKERLGLAAVVQSAVETSRPLIEASKHELTVTLPPEPIYVDADMTRLAQVFSNLLNNSAKYTERGGHIWLTVKRQGSEAVVTVRDNGMGIPAKMLPNIFEMFTQVDRTLERSQGGLGIGLTLVKRLVEMHAGSVEARSEGHGHGSEVVVRLPVVIVPTSPESQPVSPEAIATRPKHRILVVDDNVDSASSLAMMLRIMGHEVHTAHDGLAAVKAVGEFQPDLVLLDIGMPKLNGYEAARRIRDLPNGKSIVLVALTGWGQAEDKRRSEEAGFDHHLVKPAEPAVLEKLLAEL